ncbi:hypothetical protein [Flavobacterium sp.]|uniref:hypothetical protein n=1 Tax=Flavobacterium sp. TaxID=239 RepID=UPI003F69E63E
MTRKSRKISLYGIIGVFLFTFTNCEYDEKNYNYQSKNNSEKELKVSKVNYKQFSKNSKLLDKLGKFSNSSQQTSARLVYSNDNSFYIDTDFAYLIESENGEHSYTFQITRQNPQYLLENLIVNQNDSLGYSLYIAQYDINEVELEQLNNGENPNITNKLSIIPISNNTINTSTLFSRGSVEGMCLTVTIIPATSCSCKGHTITDLQNGESCTCSDSETIFPEQTIYSWGPCGEDSGGGGGDPTDGGNLDNPDNGFPTGPGTGSPSDGNSGTGNTINNPPNNSNPNPDNSFEDTNNPVLTTPTINTNVKNDPCNEIEKVIEKPQFVTNMQALKNNINGTKEIGFIIRDKEGTDAYSQILEGNNNGTVTYPYPESTPAELDLLFSSVGTAHNHITTINTQIGIFTPEDLDSLVFNGLIETHTQNPNVSTIPKKSVIFVITDKGFFALKINNLAKLIAFTNSYRLWSYDETKEYMEETFQNSNVYNIRPESSHDEQVTGFLRFIEDQDIGVDLYEGDDDNFNNFSKLSLANFGYGEEPYSFVSTPCN